MHIRDVSVGQDGTNIGQGWVYMQTLGLVTSNNDFEEEANAGSKVIEIRHFLHTRTECEKSFSVIDGSAGPLTELKLCQWLGYNAYKCFAL